MLIIPIIKSKYRVKADRPDWRDLIYAPVNTTLKETVDMRQWASPVEDQLHLGSCTGQSVVGAYELIINKELPTKFVDLSRLFVYYNARLLEGGTDEDIGAYVRDAVKSVRLYGVCKEQLWPYDITKFAESPTNESYQEAKTRNIKNYYRVLTLEDMLDAMNNDHPIVFSLQIYDAFEYLEFGNCIIPIPPIDESPIGGHAMCMVGYDLQTQRILARNSFGKDWCMDGYCWIPFEYVKSEVMDSWIFDIEIL